MTGIYIAFGLTILAAAYCCLRLSWRLKRLRKKYDGLWESYDACILDHVHAVHGKAEIKELTGSRPPFFMVYRKGFTDDCPVRYFFYNPSDRDDRDYKRICAEELAETLNEKP